MHLAKLEGEELKLLEEQIRVRMPRPAEATVTFNGRLWMLTDYKDGVATLVIWHAT